MLGAETDQGRTRRKNVVVGRKIRETNRQDIQQFFSWQGCWSWIIPSQRIFQHLVNAGYGGRICNLCPSIMKVLSTPARTSLVSSFRLLSVSEHELMIRNEVTMPGR